MSCDRHAGELADHSFTVLPGLYGPSKVERLRAAVHDLYAKSGRPPLYSKVPQWRGENLEISGTGLVFHKLLGFAPELEGDLLEPEAVALLRRVLGEDMHLEFVGAVVADHTRPFFAWHNHVGGIDDEKFRRIGLHPEIEVPERIAMLVYLDEMGPGTGQMLIWPQRVSGAAPPPGDPETTRWDGQLEVSGPAGTVVMLDQCSWHAVLPRTIDHELRTFIGLWFAGASVPKAERVDESLFDIDAADPLLRSVLPKRGRHA